MNPQFFKCGCRIIDIDTGNHFVKLRFDKCKKHKKEFEKCSYFTWKKLTSFDS